MSGTIFVTVARILEVHGLKLSGTVPQIMIALLQDFNSSMGRWSYYIKQQDIFRQSRSKSLSDIDSGTIQGGNNIYFLSLGQDGDISPERRKCSVWCAATCTYWLPDGSTVDTVSEALIGTTDPNINNGWQRLTVSFSVPSNATSVRCNIMVVTLPVSMV